MNILFVSEYFWPRPAGGEVWSWELCKALAEKGHHVIVITTNHDESPEEQREEGVRILRPVLAGNSLLGRKLASNNLMKHVTAFCEEEHVDIIHVMAYALNVAVSKTAAYMGIPCLTSVHSRFGSAWRYISWMWPLNMYLENRYLKKDMSKAMHVPSAYLQEKIERKTVVIHNWLPEKFPKKMRLAKNTYLFVGSLEKVKNPLACLDVAKNLIVIGSGSLEKKLIKQAEEKGVHIKIMNDCSREETLSYIGGASMVLVPSIEESFSMVALEAVAQGTPVAGSAVGIIPNLPGTTGWPPETIPKVTGAQKAAVKKKFSKHAAIAEFEKLYRKLEKQKSVITETVL